MNDQFSLNKIDSALFQLALHSREVSRKKNEIDQRITVCRADIAKKRSHNEAVQKNIKKLKDEIRMKQSAVNGGNVKSKNATHSLLLQYNQTLRAELDNRKITYNSDMEVYKERITTCWKKFQSQKEYFYQNPLAQKLLKLQAENEETKCSIKACDDQIKITEKELDSLTGPEVDSASNEKLPDSVPGQQPIGAEKQLDPQTEEESSSSIDISSLNLNQTKVQCATVSSPPPEEESSKQWSCYPLDEQIQPDEMHTEVQEQEPGQEDQVLQATASGVEGAMEERAAIDEGQAPSEEDEGLAAFPQSSPQETIPQPSPAEMTAVPSTPTFRFAFSPDSPPRKGPSDTKSPAFLFSLNSEPSTPGFSGFGFDFSSSQDEETSFAFSGSLFNVKKTTESKSSACPEFLFGQPEQGEDFQFTFSSKSPQATNKDNTRDEFPFSFNF
uniref:uncharacterized protein LOC117251480 n=1 Tax=Epinephelus lanceolatus TaxID=310571 RepID=UPI001446E791|nr:uncharacterized protein LOC117251480 [Epinephelus lanceolatus]